MQTVLRDRQRAGQTAAVSHFGCPRTGLGSPGNSPVDAGRVPRRRLAVLAATLVVLGGLAAFGQGGDERPQRGDAAGEYIKVEVRGTLRTGIVAIGGETTGTTITAKGITWELDLGRDQKLRQNVEKLDGQTVVVKGTLERRPGVEVPERWIVSVTSLEPARAAGRERK